MKTKAEQTRQAILDAATQLFAVQGYDAVTMRQIAKQAGCSHTTIYIYFKDKESLLQELATEPLQQLHHELEALLSDGRLAPEQRLTQITQTFIQFGLTNGNLYNTFFMAEAERVDLTEPERELSRLRNQLFSLLRQAIHNCIAASDEQNLAFTRIYFYTVHGIIATYNGSKESAEELNDRLETTFALAIKVLLAGFRKETLQ